jgi:hypothetical protein
VVERFSPVALLVTDTVALASNAPLESVTEPTIEPVEFWEYDGSANVSINTHTHHTDNFIKAGLYSAIMDASCGYGTLTQHSLRNTQ